MIYKALVKDDKTYAVSVVSCDVETTEEMYETLGKNGYIPFKGVVKPAELFDRLMGLTFFLPDDYPIWNECEGGGLSEESLVYLLEICGRYNRDFKYRADDSNLKHSSRIRDIIDYFESLGKEISIKQTHDGQYLYEGDII